MEIGIWDFVTIGLFDSGLGGLTVLKEVQRVLPNAHFLYLGDSAHLPFGTKSPRTISAFLLQGAGFLARHEKLDAFVIACATASSVYLEEGDAFRDAVSRASGAPVFDVLSPMLALGAQKNFAEKTLCLLGTPTTVASQIFDRALPRNLIKQACPLLVPLIEEGLIDHPVTTLMLKEYLRAPQAKSADAYILGCTHYPIVAHQIRDIIGEKPELIDLGTALAQHMQEYFPMERTKSVPRSPRERFFVTDQPYRFSEISQLILGRPIQAERAAVA